MKPRGLGWLTLVMAVLNPMGFLFIEPPRSLALVVTCGIIVVVSYGVLWAFWRGRSWARWLVLLTSVLALVNLISITTLSPLLQAIVLAEAILGGYLLYWLNTGPVKAYFRSQRAPSVA